MGHIPKSDVLEALFATLRAKAELIAIMPDTDGQAKVYTPGGVPENTIPPYLVLTDVQFTRPRNTFGTDGTPRHGYEFLLTVDSWSKYQGQKEITDIQNVLYDGINEVEHALTGYSWVNAELMNNHVIEDTLSSVRLQHGVDRYIIHVEEA